MGDRRRIFELLLQCASLARFWRGAPTVFILCNRSRPTRPLPPHSQPHHIYIYMRIAVRKPTCTIGYGISLRGCSVLRRCDHMGDNEGNAARAANVASRGRGRADAHLRRMGLYRSERRYGKQAQ